MLTEQYQSLQAAFSVGMTRKAWYTFSRKQIYIYINEVSHTQMTKHLVLCHRNNVGNDKKKEAGKNKGKCNVYTLL